MTPQPRILFITGEYPPRSGGVGDYAALLRAAIEDLGAVGAVITRGSHAGCGVTFLDHWGPGSLRTIARMARQHDANVLHVQYQAGAFQMRPTVNLLPSLLGWQLRLPVVTTFHDLRSPYLFPKAGRLRQRVITQMARASTRAIVTNPTDYRELRRRGVKPIQIPIGSNVPHPIESPPVDTDTVAFFGFGSNSKGIQQLLDAVGHIPGNRRPTVRWIGSAGKPSLANDMIGMDELDRIAANRGVTMQRTGQLDAADAGRELARAGVIVLPFLEGVSLRSGSLLAAVDSGRPVVTTAPDCLEDLGSVGSMRQLTLVPRRHQGALAGAIESALSHSVGSDPLPEEFSWGSIALRHMDLYARLLAGAPL